MKAYKFIKEGREWYIDLRPLFLFVQIAVLGLQSNY